MAYESLVMVSKTASPAESTISNNALDINNTTETSDLNLEKHTQQRADIGTQLLCHMSHEIRTPLAGIAGIIDMLMASKPSKEQEPLLEDAQYACTHLIELLNSILDFSRLEAQQDDIHLEPFNLPMTLELVSKSLRSLQRQANTPIHLVIDPDIPKYLVGDKKRLQQILFNLCGNSLKYSQNKPVYLIVRLKEGDSETCHVTFSIQDFGIGIDPKHLESILEEFKTLENPEHHLNQYNPYQASSGIGLYLCNRYLKLLGSKLHINSVPGEGTTVTFTLPFTICEPVQAKTPATFLEAAPRSILLVEDSPLNQMVTQHQLQRKGHCVTVANDAKEAIEAYQNSIFDLVILDIQLRDSSGLDLIQKLKVRSKNTSSKQPIFIALTANATSTHQEACLKVGFDHFLTKPLSDKRLNDILRA